MKALILLAALSALVLAEKPRTNVPQKSLFVYCAAGMRKPMETLARDYETSNKTKLELTYDGTNKLLGQIKLTRKGDVYIAGDADYIAMARKDNLVGEAKTLCYFIPVIMVKKGNPLKISGFVDLMKPGIKVGQADDKAAAVGRIMPKLLALNGIDTVVWKNNIVVSTPTVNELGIAVKLGTIDATVVWNAVAAMYSDASDTVIIPSDKNVVAEVEGAILAFSKDKTEAKKFLDYLVSDKAKQVLNANHYVTEDPRK